MTSTTAEAMSPDEIEAPAEKGPADPGQNADALADVMAPARNRVRIAVVLQVLASVATIVPFVGMAELAKTFLTTGTTDQSKVWMIVGIVVAALVARTVLGGFALVLTHAADLRVQHATRVRMVERLGQAPLGWFSRHASGLVRKATTDDIAAIHYLVAHAAVDAAAAITVPLAGVAYLLVLDWRLALAGVATIPIYVAVYAVMTRGAAEKSAQVNAGLERISQTIVEFVSGISVVKTFGQAGRAHAAYRKAAEEFSDGYAGWVGPMLRTDALATIPISAPVVLLVNLACGAWFVSAGWVSVVDVVTAAVVAMTLPTAIMKVSFSMEARQSATAAAGRIATVLATPVLPEPGRGREPSSDEVRFEDVSFSYDGQHRVLDDINLTLPEGKVTALVGPSGSGKSTLASLAARFSDPTVGRVLLGGVDLREMTTDTLYQHVGFVLQDVQLLQASVADNIRLARPDASLDEVRHVARLAQIDDHLTGLPRGYDSVIGVDAQLSGGQAQRVSIARALLADPPVLILDEATAFTDPESEARIQAALSHLVGGRTLLVIAHRLATISTADQIVVLDHGRITETGTHRELLAADGQYARMWHAHRHTTVEESQA